MSATELPIGDLSVAATLDTAGDLYRRDFRILICIALLLLAPWSAISTIAVGLLSPHSTPLGGIQYFINFTKNPHQAAMEQDLSNTWLVTGISGFLSVMFILFIIPLTTGAITRAASMRYLNMPAGSGECIRWVFHNFWRVVLTSWMKLGIMLGTAVAVSVIFFLPVAAISFSGINNGPGMQLLGLLLAVLGIGGASIVLMIVNFRTALIIPIIATEGIAYSAAISRSFYLSRRRVSRAFWLSFISSAIAFYLSAGINVIPNIWVLGLIGAFAASITTALDIAINTVFYFNCRALHENLDIFLLAARGAADSQPSEENANADA